MYLRYIDTERTARESRQMIGEGKWTMVKRTEQNRTPNQHLCNNCDTSIQYVQDHYFHYDVSRVTGALATGRKGLRV
jgi:hypothetical protein